MYLSFFGDDYMHKICSFLGQKDEESMLMIVIVDFRFGGVVASSTTTLHYLEVETCC